MSWTSGRPDLVRAASSATIALMLFSAGLLVLALIDGIDSTRLAQALGFLSVLWTVGWPLGLVTLMWRGRRVSDRPSALVVAPDASTTRSPSSTLAMVGAAFFLLSVAVVGGALAQNVLRAVQENQPADVEDPRDPPELPESFSAVKERSTLIEELELYDVWSTTHPEYDGEVRVLISSAPVEGLSPNYSAAFYRREGDAFIRIGKGFGFGGYHPPELGRHPTLDVPAIVCLAEALPEYTYFFVHAGESQTLQENEETWRPVEELR